MILSRGYSRHQVVCDVCPWTSLHYVSYVTAENVERSHLSLRHEGVEVFVRSQGDVAQM